MGFNEANFCFENFDKSVKNILLESYNLVGGTPRKQNLLSMGEHYSNFSDESEILHYA